MPAHSRLFYGRLFPTFSIATDAMLLDVFSERVRGAPGKRGNPKTNLAGRERQRLQYNAASNLPHPMKGLISLIFTSSSAVLSTQCVRLG